MPQATNQGTLRPGFPNQLRLCLDDSVIATNHAERDKHLRNEDFFNVRNYPTITFKSTRYYGDEYGGMLTGDLTLLGVTK